MNVVPIPIGVLTLNTRQHVSFDVLAFQWSELARVSVRVRLEFRFSPQTGCVQDVPGGPGSTQQTAPLARHDVALSNTLQRHMCMFTFRRAGR